MPNEFEGFPLIVGWELTLACNLRCRHCGSSAGEQRDDELSLDECLAICDQLPELLTVEVVFTGGEPLMSPHWEPVAMRLKEHGIVTGMVTNGTWIKPAVVERLKSAGVTAVAVSLDGCEATHDYVRATPGIYGRIVDGIRQLVAAQFTTTVITTVSALSAPELPQMLELMRDLGIKRWQLQPIFPFGRTRECRRLLLSAGDYLMLGRFIEEYAGPAVAWGLEICPADGVGYCSDIRTQGPSWKGCNAGILSCGIMSDGRVKGCLSWPDELVEGDLRTDSLWDIWFHPEAFAQTRRFTTADLSGACAGCGAGAECGGGCSAISYAATGRFHADPYCFRSILNGTAETELVALKA